MTEFIKMTWQRGRQLATLQKGSTAVSYQYNESGLRTKKTVNGVSTIYDRDASGNIVHQKGGNNELWYYYDAQGNIGSISHNGTRYALRKNAQGDVIALMDTNGDVAAQYAYDAWGNVLDVTDYRGRTITDPNHVALANPIRYRGYFYDTETGFYHLQSRYYDPMTCRYLNADATTDGGAGLLGINLFIYAANNPVNNCDPSGHWIIKNAIKWFAKDIVKPVVKKVRDTVSKLNFTTSHGFTINAAASAEISTSIGISQDAKGNISIQKTINWGGGTPTAGISHYETITNAPTIDKLEGRGLQTGGSLAVGPAAVGAEYIAAFDTANGKTYHGISISGGVGAPVPIEMHGETGKTETLCRFNVFDSMKGIYVKIMEW